MNNTVVCRSSLQAHSQVHIVPPMVFYGTLDPQKFAFVVSHTILICDTRGHSYSITGWLLYCLQNIIIRIGHCVVQIGSHYAEHLTFNFRCSHFQGTSNIRSLAYCHMQCL